MKYFIYILECFNNSFYVGYTTDIKRRYQEHKQGTAKCKYTRSFPPKKIAACWQLSADLASVLKIEYAIKQLSKSQKQFLCLNQDTISKMVTSYLNLEEKIIIESSNLE